MACSLKDAATANRLYRKYISFHGDVDLARLQREVRRETLAAERGAIRVTRGLLQELRADRATVGRLRRLGC